jgi:hypothetical protein
VLLGTNANEGSTFLPLHNDATEADLDAWIAQQFGGNATANGTFSTDAVLAAYPVADFTAHSSASAAWWAGSEVCVCVCVCVRVRVRVRMGACVRAGLCGLVPASKRPHLLYPRVVASA